MRYYTLPNTSIQPYVLKNCHNDNDNGDFESSDVAEPVDITREEVVEVVESPDAKTFPLSSKWKVTPRKKIRLINKCRRLFLGKRNCKACIMSSDGSIAEEPATIND